jgi:glutathione S-transferase
MIAVHPLNESRSQRVLWRLAELEAPDEIRNHQRDATRLTPPEPKQVHPLSSTREDGGQTLIESSAMVDCLIHRHGAGARGLRTRCTHMDAWVHHFQQRPAYQRALKWGGHAEWQTRHGFVHP